MTINYLDILIEYNELTLPSVGKLSVHHFPAEIDREQQLIYPPRKKINFQPAPSSVPDYSKELADYLQMKFGWARDEAIAFSRTESQAFLEKKNKASIIPIPFVGRMFAGKNGEWLFTPDDIEIFREERRGFPVVSYLPVEPALSAGTGIPSPAPPEDPLDRETSDIIVRPAEPLPVKPKRSSFSWWPFSLAAMVMLVAFFLWQQQTSKKSPYKVFRMASPETRINIKPLEGDRLYPGNDIETSEETEEDSGIFGEESGTYDSGGHSEGPGEDRGEDVLPEGTEREGSTAPPAGALKDFSIAEISTDNPELGTNDCLLIVGAFASVENVEKMRERLSVYGSNVVADRDVRLTRVGVLLPCDSEELPALLERLKNEVNAGAWVMKKK